MSPLQIRRHLPRRNAIIVFQSFDSLRFLDNGLSKGLLRMEIAHDYHVQIPDSFLGRLSLFSSGTWESLAWAMMLMLASHSVVHFRCPSYYSYSGGLSSNPPLD